MLNKQKEEYKMEHKFIEDYKEFLDNNKFEDEAVKTIKKMAEAKGFEMYSPIRSYYRPKEKIIYPIKNKGVALIVMGEESEDEGANLVVSHIDSPRLDVMPGECIYEDEGVFMRTVPYGGIIYQLWLDRPLALTGTVYDEEGNKLFINTEKDGYTFTITSLLPHLNGRKEVKEMKPDILNVRVGNNEKDNILEFIMNKYKVPEENLAIAKLSFVPAGEMFELGYDKELLAGYGHDDRSCAYAELRAILSEKVPERTAIALFVSYEETGSNQSTGAISELIDDMFYDIGKTRRGLRDTKVLSADVCAAYDSQYASHFVKESAAKAGKGIGLVPFTGLKRGSDVSAEFLYEIKTLCKDNSIDYQIDTTKASEGGGGTVAMYFATRGMEVLDAGIPVLAMHSPQEVIAKNDIEAAYKLYKAFFGM